MWLQVLFTVFAIVAAVVAVFAAGIAHAAQTRAEHSEHRLSIMRGQVKGLEVSVVALDEQHKKLAGRVYADEYWRGKRKEQPDLNLTAPTAPDGSSYDVCDNWARAQQDGPGSKAAQCTCAYCESMRNARAARRATLRRVES